MRAMVFPWAALFLDLGSELFDLGLPGHERRLVVHVGDIHDVHVLLRGKELIGLLLAVASVLADYQVARLDVGADLAQLKAGKALDERAGVARPMAVPNWKLFNLIEKAGGIVVGEESCTGSRYYKDLVDESGETVDEMLDAIAERYFKINCAVFTQRPAYEGHRSDGA